MLDYEPFLFFFLEQTAEERNESVPMRITPPPDISAGYPGTLRRVIVAVAFRRLITPQRQDRPIGLQGSAKQLLRSEKMPYVIYLSLSLIVPFFFIKCSLFDRFQVSVGYVRSLAGSARMGGRYLPIKAPFLCGVAFAYLIFVNFNLIVCFILSCHRIYLNIKSVLLLKSVLCSACVG